MRAVARVLPANLARDLVEGPMGVERIVGHFDYTVDLGRVVVEGAAGPSTIGAPIL
jgi:hypothetical protein